VLSESGQADVDRLARIVCRWLADWERSSEGDYRAALRLPATSESMKPYRAMKPPRTW